jgi:ADP-ribose pyrophosphatase YjhB (NUDIX family)
LTNFFFIIIFITMGEINRYGGILVKSGNECLLCKRNSKGSLPGQWSVPAGQINKNEPPLIGSKREFFEETDIKVNGDIKLIGFLTRKDREGKKNKGLLYLFLLESDKKIIPDLENAKDGDEHTECDYFTKDNLPIDKNDQLFRIIEKILD